jgi:Cell division control protein 14, SIN component
LLTNLASRDRDLIVSVIETLEAILVDSSENIYAFEESSGLSLICSVLKQMKESESVTHKCIELLAIYLSQEEKYSDYTSSRDLVAKRSILADQLGLEFVTVLEQTLAF